MLEQTNDCITKKLESLVGWLVKMFGRVRRMRECKLQQGMIGERVANECCTLVQE